MAIGEAVTLHHFTKLGMRTLPIGKAGFSLERAADGKKHIANAKGETLSFAQALPQRWTSVYGDKKTSHYDSPLGGLICGRLQGKANGEREVIALDCDSQAAWDTVDALNPSYSYKFKSIGKPGGTMLYLLPEELRDQRQYSVTRGSFSFEYMAQRESGPNAMVYLPTSANRTKCPLPEDAELLVLPPELINLVLLLAPSKAPLSIVNSNVSKTLPFNQPLVAQMVLESKAASEVAGGYGKLEDSKVLERVLKVFTPKKFRGCKAYEANGWLHPNSPEIMEMGGWSEYIIGMSAIAGADVSIDLELYVEFMQVLNAQVDDPMPQQRYLTEVIKPMSSGKSMVQGKPIWQYNEKWDQDSHTIVNQRGETLEYFSLEGAANTFIEYNHETKEVVEVKGPAALRDQIYQRDKSVEGERPPLSIVKKLKLAHLEESVKLPVGVFTDSKGHTVINRLEPSLSLSLLMQPDGVTVGPDNHYAKAFDVFIAHLLDNDEEGMLFLKQILAYHGRHLENIPIIIYVVGLGGTGKSLFCEFLSKLFGKETTSSPSAKQVTGRFNDFLENKALLILAETSDASARDREGIKEVLKRVTGEPTIDIEEKNKPTRTGVPIFTLPILTANSAWYEEDLGDRRLFSIIPPTALDESPDVLDFEKGSGVRLVKVITEGIANGSIARYISSFCPAQLPPVPLTKSKLELSAAQENPIILVKNLVELSNWTELCELMHENSITDFIEFMDGPSLRKTKEYAYQRHLRDLMIALRGSSNYTFPDTAIKKALTERWILRDGRKASQTSASLARAIGGNDRVRWEAPGLDKAYIEWKEANKAQEELEKTGFEIELGEEG